MKENIPVPVLLDILDQYQHPLHSDYHIKEDPNHLNHHQYVIVHLLIKIQYLFIYIF